METQNISMTLFDDAIESRIYMNVVNLISC